MAESGSTTTVHSVELELRAVLQDFIRGLRESETQSKQSVQGIARDFQGVRRDIDGARDSVRQLGGQLTGLLATLGLAVSTYRGVKFLEEITQLAGRVEVLEVVSQNMGRTAGYTREEIIKYVQAVKDLNITTQQANLTVTKFIQSGLGLDYVTKIAMVARDTGVIMNKSTQETLAGLVHGIITLQPEVLRTYGIITNLDLAYRQFARTNNITYDEITQQQKQQIALNEVLDKGKVFVGTYETAMTKAQKQMLSLIRVTEEFKVSIGREFQALFSFLIESTTKFLTAGTYNNEVKQVFRDLADIFLGLIKSAITLFDFLWTNRDTIKTVLEVAVIAKITSSLLNLASAISIIGINSGVAGGTLKLFGSTFSLIVGGALQAEKALVTFRSAIATLAPIVAPVIGFLVGFNVLDKFPAWANVAIAALGGLTAIFVRLGVVASATWSAILGPVGTILAVAGIVGLVTSSISSLADTESRAEYQSKQLGSQIVQTSMEFVSLRTTAYNLAKDILTLGEKTNLTAEETAQLSENYDRLRTLAPDIVKEVTGVKNIIEESARVSKILNDQLVTLQLASLSTKVGTVEADIRKLVDASNQARVSLSGVATPGGNDLEARLNGFSFAAQNFVSAVEGGALPFQTWINLSKEYKSLADQLRESISPTSDLTNEQRKYAQIYYNQLVDEYIQLSRLGNKLEEREATLQSIRKLEIEQSVASEETTKKEMTREEQRRLQLAQEKVLMQIKELQYKSETDFLERKRIAAEKDIEQAKIALGVLKDAGGEGTGLYKELNLLVEKYLGNQNDIANTEYQILRTRRELREAKIGLDRSDTTQLQTLRDVYARMIESLSAIPTQTEESTDLIREFKAEWVALGKEIDDVNDKNRQKAVDDADREQRRIEREQRIFTDVFLRGTNAGNLFLQQFIGAYKGFIQTIIDLEMTGKERRENIWRESLRTFENIIDLMIRRYLLFYALTGIFGVFGLPTGVIGPALGLRGLDGGTFSTGDNSQTIKELRNINRSLDGGRSPSVHQTISVQADRISATVAVGDRERRRSSLNG